MGRPKKAATAASTRGQNTLSFTQKITKSSAPTTRFSKSVDQKKPVRQSPVADIQPDSPPPTLKESEADAKQPTDQKLALRQQLPAAPAEPAEAPKELSPEEEEALHLTDARIKKYWKVKEDARMHPRVHQKNLPIYDRILREFDLSSHYGPCIGIARSKRWHRANKLGLNPPLEVLAVLLKSDGPVEAREKSQVDELMASRFAIEA